MYVPPKPLCPMLNCAVQTVTKIVWPQWFDQGTNAPSTFKALRREFEERKRITVYDGGSGRTIFDDPGINVMFRAWHDWCHLALGADFTLEGERVAADMQMQHVVTLYGNKGTGMELCRLIDAEVNGQAMYYHLHKKYIANQRGFVEKFLVNPLEALNTEWE